MSSGRTTRISPRTDSGLIGAEGEPGSADRAVARVLWITLGLNIGATAAKLAAGIAAGSLSLIADGLDSLFDSATNVLGLAGLAIAARPPDARHPYGHRKAESLTTLLIAGLLFVTTWELVKSALARLLDPSLIRTDVTAWGFAALGLSVAIHVIVVAYELSAGRRLGSPILIADAMHTRADILISLSVAAGLIAVRIGFPLADPILALVIAAVILKIGIEILLENFPTLIDAAALPSDELERIALSVPGVLSVHRARSRGHAQAVYADLHIRVRSTLPTAEAHGIAHEVQRRVRDQMPNVQDVTIHVEPSGPREL